MLASSPVAATLPVKDLIRARKFYEDKLGLKSIESSSSGVLYKSGKDTGLFIYEVKEDSMGSAAANYVCKSKNPTLPIKGI